MEGEEKNLGECEKTNFFRELGCEEKGKGERADFKVVDVEKAMDFGRRKSRERDLAIDD